MKKRMISEEMLYSKTFGGLSDQAQLLWLKMLSLADDFGVAPGDPYRLCKQVAHRGSEEEVDKLLREIVKAEAGFLFEYEEKTFFIFPARTFDKIQGFTLNKRTKSEYTNLRVDELNSVLSKNFQEIPESSNLSSTFLRNTSSLGSAVVSSKKKDNINIEEPFKLSAQEKKDRFEEIWAKYPEKSGKRDAERHFNASVQTLADWENIQKALDNYLKSDRVARGYTQNGKTWFNNWPDWINPTPYMMGKKEKDSGVERKKVSVGRGWGACSLCGEMHDRQGPCPPLTAKPIGSMATKVLEDLRGGGN